MSTAVPNDEKVVRPSGPYAPPIVHGGFCLAVALASVALLLDWLWQAPVIFFAVIAVTGVVVAASAHAARAVDQESRD